MHNYMKTDMKWEWQIEDCSDVLLQKEDKIPT